MSRTTSPAAVVPPSVVILGSDALLAALPATPTQLANACYAAAFEGVFPSSWGDELVAAGCLKDLETHLGPAILCTCPLVSEQLRGVAPLQRYQLHLVSPPVAAARYLRALCDDAPLRITYVGECPGAEDPAIDERVAPEEFLRRLAERGITPLSQRPDLGANVPRDRRRFYSLPGGAPTPEWLSADWPKRSLVDSDAGGALADLAHTPLSRESTLIDFAPQLGCACSGAVGGIAAADARRAVIALEPPRARQEVLDPDLKITVQAMVPQVRASREVSWDDFLASLPVALTPANAAATRVPEPPLAAEPVEPAAPLEPAAPAAREPVPAMPPARPSSSSAVTRMSGPGVRTTQPIPRRAPVVEGMSGPRYLPAAAPKLSRSDRWMLVAVVLVASVLSSALTAYFTARAFASRAPRSESLVVATPPRDSVLARHLDTVAVAPVVIPAHAPPLGDQRVLAGTMPAPAPLKRTIPIAPTRPAPTRAATRSTGELAAPAPAAAAIIVAPPPAPAPEPPPQPVPVAAPVVVPPQPAPTKVDSAPPAAASPTNAEVAAELQAIRDELNARKRRVDSLTKSLDSMKAVPPPR
jgi:hypothetical protein